MPAPMRVLGARGSGVDEPTVFQVSLSNIRPRPEYFGGSVAVVGGAMNRWTVLSRDVTTLEGPLEVVLHAAAFSSRLTL